MSELNDSVFRDFINTLDIDTRDMPVPVSSPDIPSNITANVLRFKSENAPGMFEYDIDISLKHFRTFVYSTPGQESMAIEFPSKTTGFEITDHADVVGKLIDLAYPGKNQVPWATVESEGKKKNFDLNNFWDGHQLTRTLEQDASVTSVAYSVLSSPSTTQRGSTGSLPQTYFRYTFKKTQHESLENIALIQADAQKITTDITSMLLERHFAFSGSESDSDSDLLVEVIKKLCSDHPLILGQ